MKFLLGIKKNMSQMFDEGGNARTVTIISAPASTVTTIKTLEKDGYSAVQVGAGEKKPKNIAKAQKGQFKNLGSFRFLKEFRGDAGTLKAGDKIESSIFAAGDLITVSAISKGKGFQGTVKRHHFKGGSRTHGQKHSERDAGAIGGGARAGGRVAKGIRMSGRMGGDRVTTKNLTVLKVLPETSEILIEGSLPGVRGALVEIREA